MFFAVLCALIRQPSVGDPAFRAVCRLPADGAPASPGALPAGHRSAWPGGLRRRVHCSTRPISWRSGRHRRAGALAGPAGRILVRRHQGGLARIDGARHPVPARDRLAMWIWDAQQQFGMAGSSLPRSASAAVVDLPPLGRPRLAARSGSTRCSPSPTTSATRTSSSCPATSSRHSRPEWPSHVHATRSGTAGRRLAARLRLAI